MNKSTLLIGVLLEEDTSMSFSEVCHKYSIPKQLLIEMIEYGLFANPAHDIEQSHLNSQDLHRLESAFRLHRDLGVNLAGVALALDLLEKIEQMQQELEILKRHF